MNHIIHTLILVLSSTTLTLAQICPGVPGEVEWHYWRNLPDDEFGELTASPFFPDASDGHEVLNSMVSPYRFDNNFGSIIRGFIQIPVSENIVFNVTGDDKVRFNLSTDDQPANLQVVAFTDGWTGEEEHDKYPEQTSSSISLQAGQFYYFELWHVEGGGGDHATVWWKTSFTGLTEWHFISSDYLYSTGCLAEACDPPGTPCNDGDATTTNDQYDGYCHCVGRPATTNPCIGDRAEVVCYFYDTIPGNSLDDLYGSADFPTLPDRSENLNLLGRYRENVTSNYGSLVQAYLSVPVTGNYQFNVTGDNQSGFFLSTDEDPVNILVNEITTDNSTGMTQHDDQPSQTSGQIWLEAGAYYYFELHHKQGGGWGHFRVFWKTPFNTSGDWKAIPSTYIYDYECELACIPEGTPCDDGDPFTNNDQYDSNCDCIGTPCSGPDCNDPIASYVPFDVCGLTNELDDRPEAGWLSCQTSVSANAARGDSHWLQYDLGGTHRLYESHIWNYNAPGQADQGIQTVAIDYSEDGQTWTELGTYNWTQAPGSTNYAGFIGPDFGGLRARYLLFTDLENNPCAGLGKISIYARQCGPQGSVCDDGNPATYNDQFDADCNCAGVLGDPLDCLLDSLMLGDSLLLQSNYSALRFLESRSTVIENSQVTFTANEDVVLKPGFEGESGGVLIIQLDDCQTSFVPISQSTQKALIQAGLTNPLIVSNLKNPERQMISYYLDKPGPSTLTIEDLDGHVVGRIVNYTIKNRGHYRKRINTHKLTPGIYTVRYMTNGAVFIEKMQVGTD